MRFLLALNCIDIIKTSLQQSIFSLLLFYSIVLLVYVYLFISRRFSQHFELFSFSLLYIGSIHCFFVLAAAFEIVQRTISILLLRCILASWRHAQVTKCIVSLVAYFLYPPATTLS